jgi:hypothetical protein
MAIESHARQNLSDPFARDPVMVADNLERLTREIPLRHFGGAVHVFQSGGWATAWADLAARKANHPQQRVKANPVLLAQAVCVGAAFVFSPNPRRPCAPVGRRGRYSPYAPGGGFSGI